MDESPKPVGAFLPQVRQEKRQANCETHGAYTSDGYSLGRNMHWLGCPECAKLKRAAEELAQQELEASQRQERMEAKLDTSGIPVRYRTKDFASFIADTDAKEKARAVAMEFAQNFDRHMKNGTVVVFSGLPGTGKSHLAIAIAQAVMTRYTALYTSAIDAIRMIRDTWRRDSGKTENEVLDMLASVGLLVLDEVGVQHGTEAEKVHLFDMIDKRYRDMMPTILLTNHGTAGLKAYLGERSYDRLREGGIWVKFDWQSQRGASAPKN